MNEDSEGEYGDDSDDSRYRSLIIIKTRHVTIDTDRKARHVTIDKI